MDVVEVEAPYDPPHGNTIVWRYMPLDKFLSLVLSRSLFFANATQMTDRREGTIPEKTLAAERRRLEGDGLAGRDLEEALDGFSFQLNALKDSTLLSCWSVNRSESYALWKIYLGGSRSGVAIRSTVGRLKKALGAASDPTIDRVYCGGVRYTDFIQPELLSRWSVNLTKGHFYEFEQELRLLVLHHPGSEGGSVPSRVFRNGYPVPVDTNTLIDRIYVSPFAGEWFQTVFTDLVSRIDPDLSLKVRPSDVLDE